MKTVTACIAILMGKYTCTQCWYLSTKTSFPIHLSTSTKIGQVYIPVHYLTLESIGIPLLYWTTANLLEGLW